MSEELAEQGISIRLLRDLERNDGIRQELYGWYIEPGEPGETAPKDDAE